MILPENISITHDNKWKVGNHEDGYLIGINNILDILNEINDDQISKNNMKLLENIPKLQLSDIDNSSSVDLINLSNNNNVNNNNNEIKADETSDGVTDAKLKKDCGGTNVAKSSEVTVPQLKKSSCELSQVKNESISNG